MTAISFQEASLRSELPKGEIERLGGLGYFKIIQNPFITMIDSDSFDTYLANPQKPHADGKEEIIGKTKVGEKIMENKLISKIILITPEMAQKCLSKNPLNRRIDPVVVRRYAEEMRTSRWRITHQGICFDENGNLLDGQHRLAAIVKCGIAQWMFVVKGVPRTSCPAIDTGRMRSLSNHAQMLAMPHRNEHAAIAKILACGITANPRGIPPSALFEMIDEYWDGIDFAVSKTQGVSRAYAAVRAVIARAYYSSPPTRIEEFIEVFKTQLPSNEHDHAAASLKKYLLTLESTMAIRVRLDVYQKTENALRAFLEYRPLSLIRTIDRELFLLPGETQKIANAKMGINEVKNE